MGSMNQSALGRRTSVLVAATDATVAGVALAAHRAPCSLPAIKHRCTRRPGGLKVARRGVGTAAPTELRPAVTIVGFGMLSQIRLLF